MRVGQVATKLGVSASLLRRLERQGKLPRPRRLRVGKRLERRYTPDDVREIEAVLYPPDQREGATRPHRWPRPRSSCGHRADAVRSEAARPGDVACIPLIHLANPLFARARARTRELRFEIRRERWEPGLSKVVDVGEDRAPALGDTIRLKPRLLQRDAMQVI